MLLAPAGSLDAAAQAFAAGADAVYAGLKGWSRGGARGELDREQLRQCIELAHGLGRKVQLALNIIPRSPERERLLEELGEAADVGDWTPSSSTTSACCATSGASCRRWPSLSVSAAAR